MINLLEYNKESKKSCFLFDSVPLALMNSFRRIMLCNMKNSGIELCNITVIKNTSTYNDEMIKNRISLLPILHFPDVLSCIIEMNVINATESQINVTTDSLQITNGNALIYPDILLCQLKPGEEIQIVVKSDINNCVHGGIGYRPVTTVWFKPISLIYCKLEFVESIQTYFSKCDFKIYELSKLPNKAPNKAPNNLQCLGFCTNLRDLNVKELLNFLELKSDSDIIIIKKNENIYAYFFETFFKEYGPMAILNDAISLFQQKMQYLLKNPINYKFNQKQAKMIIKFENAGKQNKITATELSPLVFYLRRHKNIYFSHYDKLHPDSEIFYLHVIFHKTEDSNIQQFTNIFKECINDILQSCEDISTI